MENVFLPKSVKHIATDLNQQFKQFLDTKRSEGLFLQKIVVDGLVFSEDPTNPEYLFVDHANEHVLTSENDDPTFLQAIIDKHAKEGFRFVGGINSFLF